MFVATKWTYMLKVQSLVFSLLTLNSTFPAKLWIQIRIQIQVQEYEYNYKYQDLFRSSHPEVFLGKGVLKIGNKFTGEHPCRSAISIKLQDNFIEITLRHGCSSVNLLYIFRTPLGDCSCLFFKYYYRELKKNLFYVHFNPLATNVPII